jgi:hypothetical protein
MNTKTCGSSIYVSNRRGGDEQNEIASSHINMTYP